MLKKKKQDGGIALTQGPGAFMPLGRNGASTGFCISIEASYGGIKGMGYEERYLKSLTVFYLQYCVILSAFP